MLDRYITLIGNEYQGETAFSHVSKIAGFHRIQASPGFRAAADYVLTEARRLGIQAEILSFPAKEGVKWWSQGSFLEWDCDDAELVLLSDGHRERLCSFQEDKISLIQRSAPTPPGGIEAQIVYIEKATDPSSYQGLNVKGKLVFSRGDVSAIAKVACEEFGALGIIVDNMSEFPPVRDRFDLPSGRQYTSFWPMRVEGWSAFGFVLTPRQGEVLRRRLIDEKKDLKAFARVRSRFYEGAIEDVTAVLPGETDEEVVAIAHLCHPQPSANDNASGSGVLIEAARTLSRLIADGLLPRPRRTIRFLWVPEMTGSYAYLSHNEARLAKFVAAVNLDMVGENQDLCKGPFLVEKPPKALPGFGGDLCEYILRTMTKETPNLGGTTSYALFKWAVTPFSGGSDHYIWADPTVGVTCPMLIQWPDKYYHTSEDTIDKVDPRMLRLVGTLAATYLYSVATLGPDGAAHIAREMGSHFSWEMSDALTETIRAARAALAAVSTPLDKTQVLAKARRSLEHRAGFLAERKILDLGSLSRLAGSSPVLTGAQTAAREYILETASFLKTKALHSLTAAAGLKSPADLPPSFLPETSELESRARATVPKRVYKGPFSSRGLDLSQEVLDQQEAFRRKYEKAARSLTYIHYWTDGKRNVREIADCVLGETGQGDVEMVLDYVDLMVKVGAFTV